jgi:hypothetical protein
MNIYITTHSIWTIHLFPIWDWGVTRCLVNFHNKWASCLYMIYIYFSIICISQKQNNCFRNINIQRASSRNIFNFGVITFSPMNYHPLSTCQHELTPRPKESMQLSFLYLYPLRSIKFVKRLKYPNSIFKFTYY